MSKLQPYVFRRDVARLRAEHLAELELQVLAQACNPMYPMYPACKAVHHAELELQVLAQACSSWPSPSSQP